MGDPIETTGKLADATTELTKAARDFGGLISPPLRELVGMATDSLQVIRAKRQVRLGERLQEFLRERGLERPNRAIAPNFFLPLLERASLEGDDDLQDIWARMLANAADAGSGLEMRTAYVDLLTQMTAFDVRILAKVAEERTAVSTRELPGGGEPPNEPRDDVEIAVDNLGRLGCLHRTGWGSRAFTTVYITSLGSAFVRACTGPT